MGQAWCPLLPPSGIREQCRLPSPASHLLSPFPNALTGQMDRLSVSPSACKLSPPEMKTSYTPSPWPRRVCPRESAAFGAAQLPGTRAEGQQASRPPAICPECCVRSSQGATSPATGSRAALCVGGAQALSSSLGPGPHVSEHCSQRPPPPRHNSPALSAALIPTLHSQPLCSGMGTAEGLCL